MALGKAWQGFVVNILSALRLHWRLAVLTATLVMASTVLFLMLTPRSYTAFAIVAAMPDPDTAPNLDLVRLYVPTYAALADSDSMAASIASKYGEDPNALASAIGATVAPSTNTVNVFVSWAEPERATELANGVVEELVDFSVQDQTLTVVVVTPAVASEVDTFPPPEATLVAGGIAGVMIGVTSAWARKPRARRASPPTTCNYPRQPERTLSE